MNNSSLRHAYAVAPPLCPDMAKSIRSKRRQRVLAIRREKYKKVEVKKCWDHHLKKQLDKTEEMDVQKLQGEY